MWLNHFFHIRFDEIIYLCHLWVWTSKSPQNLNQLAGTTESSRALPEPDSNHCRNSSTKLFQDRDGWGNNFENWIWLDLLSKWTGEFEWDWGAAKQKFVFRSPQTGLGPFVLLLHVDPFCVFLVQLGLLLTIAICGLLEVLFWSRIPVNSPTWRM